MKRMNMKVALALSLVLLVATVAFAEKPKEVYTDDAPAPVGFYSQAIKFGNLVFVSGQLPIVPGSGNPPTLVNTDTTAATIQVMHNIEEILKEANLTIHDILMTTVYFNSNPPASSAQFNKAYGEYFGCTCNDPAPADPVSGKVYCTEWVNCAKPKSPPPARAGIGASSIPLGALIEVSVIAGK
jgi:2-iminobutanoate/2-iminopropanoate deaminase